MIMPPDGGIKKPSVPPAATDPVARLSAYLYFFISGNATRPIVTADASEDPESAANPAHAAIVAEAKPPRKCPIQR
jgi:hypothetical protein